MSASDLLRLLVQALFILLSVATAIDYFRHRDEIRRDIAFMFGSLGFVLFVQVITSITGPLPRWTQIVSTTVLIAQPYLLLRLVLYFRPISSAIMRVALSGMIVSWVGSFLLIATGSVIVTLAIVAYFVGINGYAMVSFVSGALTTSGVVRQRLRFAASGSGLLALALLIAGLTALVPALRDVNTVLTLLLAIVAALSFYLAFATPRWLRRTWQMEELRNFLLQTATKSAAERLSATEGLNHLCTAAIRAVGDFAAAVVQETDTGWTLHSATNTALLSSIPADGEEVFTKAWQGHKPVSIRLATDSVAGARRLRETVGVNTMYLIPIATLERDWGLLVVFVRRGSLFMEDDLSLLTLLAQQNAFFLENSLLMDELRSHSQKLEKVLEERTALLESAPDAMVIVNQQAGIELVNSQAERLFGYTREELMGQPIEMLIPEPFRSRHPAHRDLYMADPRVRAMGVGLELYALRKDGTQFPVEISLSPIETAEGVLISSTVRDITERKRAEAALAQLAAIVESSDDAIISKTLDGMVASWNGGAERLFGYSVEEVMGKPISILFPPDRMEEEAQILERLFQGENVEHYETVRVTKHGQHLPISVTISPVKNGDGQIIGASKIARDITERKRTEAALNESVERFRTLLESAPDAMIIVNTQAIIEMVNAQTEKLFGYTREELVGQPIEILIPEPYRSRHPAKRDDYIADPHVRAMGVGLELYALRKDGSQFPVEVSLSPIETTEGGLIISTVRDITERKRMEELRSLNVELEERVHERTAQLEAINKELEAFSYSVSHDLRAPLRTLDGFSQAVLEDYADTLDDTGQNLLRRIRAGSQRMGQLIDDLLQLSRLSRAEMRVTQVDLSAMAHEIAAELREQDPSREVKLIVADGLLVQGDIRLLRVALGNLLSNAWKFTGKQPEACVEFGIMERDQKQVYFVRDNGAGFDMAYADKLFGAFQRLHGMTEFEGTGIGLATVQRVLQRHGGQIWAEAAVNNGATFYFTL